MALRDLFKSPEERRREERRARRRRFREAERYVERLNETAQQLKKRRDTAWSEAREQLLAGNKFAARSALKEARHCELLSARNQAKRFACEAMLLELENAQTDQEFQAIFGQLAAVIQIDPDKTEDVMDAIQEKLYESEEGQKIWDKIAEKQSDSQLADAYEIPSLEEMEKQLEEEAAEMAGSGHEALKDSKAHPSAKRKIKSGRDKLKKLLEEENEE